MKKIVIVLFLFSFPALSLALSGCEKKYKPVKIKQWQQTMPINQSIYAPINFPNKKR